MDDQPVNQGGPKLPSCASLRELLGRSLTQHANLVAFSCEGASLTYRQLDRLSNQLAAWLLRESTLVPGDRVAIQLPNLLQYPVAALAVIKAGMVIVNINPLYTAGETEHQLRDSGARALFTLEEVLSVTSKILPGTAIEKVVVSRITDFHPWHIRQAFRLKRLLQGKRVPMIRFAARTEFHKVLARGKKYLRSMSMQSLVDLSPDLPRHQETPRLGLIQYTGGTTGIAKGAMLSDDNIMANMLQIDSVIRNHSPPPGSVMVAPLPFYHIYAFTLNFAYSLYKGYHGVLIPDPRNTDRMIRTLKRFRINGLVGISTLYQLLCKHPDFRKLDFSALSICTSGGMALSVATSRRWEVLTGCRILEGYGLTETSPLVASGNYEDYQEGKIGKPTLWTDIRIVAEDGTVLPAEEAGEIQVRGPQVMMGYWNCPEETAATLTADGWFKTGDMGILDEGGYLTVVDRIKDMIIVSGFNVYPAEIEDHVIKHPDIREAAVIGMPKKEEEGEQVKLFVISDNPDLSEEEVIRFCRLGLTPYKVPSKVEFRATLPRTSVGKVLRRQLRDDQVA